MPEVSGRSPINCCITRSRSLPGITFKDKFGRSKEATNCRASLSRNCCKISSLVILSAVAVSATMGTAGYIALRFAICVYSGLKSCPQELIQCASSMAKRLTFIRPINCVNCGETSFSGETYSNFNSPSSARASVRARCCGLIELFIQPAGTPLAIKAST